MNKAVVIIPTTGSEEFPKALESVLKQTHKNLQVFVVVDGQQFFEKVSSQLKNFNDSRIVVNYLPENVGANGFYGHRVYAGFTHLVNCDYVLYLDQDCFYDENHVESLIETIQKEGLDWSYSLRKITDKNGNYICNDECESLGKWNPVMKYNHVDTNCYCIRREIAIKVCQIWHGEWGQDRVFYSIISENFKQFNCSGKYTLNYRVDGNSGSVRPEFFKEWNKKVNDIFGGKLPWRK